MSEENKNVVDEENISHENLTNKGKNKKKLLIIILIVVLLIDLIFVYLFFIKKSKTIEPIIENEIIEPIKEENNEEEIQPPNNRVFINKVNEYSVYKEKYGKENDPYYAYYVIDDSGNEFMASLSVEENENYVRFYNDKYLVILNIKDSIVINDEHFDYNCRFFSDTKFSICLNDTIITQGKGGFGVISLKTGKNVLDNEYDIIAQDKSGNFLVKTLDKYGLFSSEGNSLLEVKYDYLGYIDNVGYITILGNDLIAYDLTLKEKPFLTDIKEEIKITNASSFYWSSGSKLIYYDISKAYYDEQKGFKYIGNDYFGNQLVIYDIYAGCYSDPVMYVVKDNKAYKIDTKDIRKSTYDCF